jgi:hypothetical protein
MRYITTITTLCIALLSLTGCFMDEKQGTRMLIQLWSQNVKSDPIMMTPPEVEIESYAFNVEKGSKWEVTSWEDALNHVITNKDNQKQLTKPAVMGAYYPGEEFQVALELWSEVMFLVIIDHTNKIFATRLYETPMNLPCVETYLHLYAHKTGGSANGWTLVNPFPDEVREPLVPEEETPEEEDDTTTQEPIE